MASKRITPPGSVQHVICRYVNRKIVVRSALQRRAYLERLERSLRFTDWQPLAYALMGNHNHLAWRAGRAPLKAIYQPLNSGYAGWFNSGGRLGPLFAGRPTNVTFDDEGAAVLFAYLHNNPVRAGVCADAADCNWTSHRAFIGDVEPPPWLDVERALDRCGFGSTPSGRLAFHDFVRSRAGEERDPEMSGESARVVRTSVRRAVGGPVELTQRHDTRRSTYGVLARPDTTFAPRWNGQAPTVVRAVARACRLSVGEVCGRSRRREVVQARRLALLVWYRFLGREQVAMGAVLGMSSSATSKLLSNVGAVARLLDRAEALAAKISGWGRPRRKRIALTV